MAEVPRIDGYSDLVQIAKGGFGVVYRARQDRLDREVALKILNIADLDDRGRQRFERECKAMGSLGWHPNVVAVFDSGITADGHPWLSMEFLEGGSLGNRVKQGPLPWQDVVVAGVQVAGALDAAHAAGVLHRDLKPENLLIGPYGEVKLGDFGIAAVEGTARTTTGHASFTADHVAPEILRRQRPSERSDLYSLASTLHTLIAGSPPFSGDPDEPIEAVMMSVLQDPPPRLDGVPDDLADLLARTLTKDPDDRPAGAEEFGRALQRVQADSGQPVTDLRLAHTTRRSDPNSGASPQAISGDPLPTIDNRLPEHARGDPRPTIVQIQPSSRADAGSRPRPPDSDRTTSMAVPPPRSRRRITVAVTVIALAGISLAWWMWQRQDTGNVTAAPQTTEPHTAATESPLATATVEVGGRPAGVAATANAVWVTDGGDGTVKRIDPGTNEATATINVGTGALNRPPGIVGGSTPLGVAATANAVWVTIRGDGTVIRIDPATNQATATINVGISPEGVAATDGAVWVTNFDSGTVTRIDPATNQAIATINVGTSPAGVATTANAVWVTNRGDGTVTRIDPDTNEITATIPVGNGPGGVAAIANAVWVANRAGSVTRINPATNQATATIVVGGDPEGVDGTSSAIFVASSVGVVVLDPATNEAFRDAIAVGDYPSGVATTANAVWVTNSSDGTVTRIDPGTG